ncbi:response regulator [Paenibacillus sp. GCM10027626]|uniref:response regulator n=1 Tax=Paenibacillus sp. GCM10027626 TaxID=3273411 RepID=UPI00363F533A
MLRDMRFNIRMKIAIGYVLVICCLSVSIVIVTGRISALQNEIETITSSDIEIHNLIASIRNATLSMETGQRGYLLTGDEAYLEPYTNGKSQWEAKYNSLSAYISNDLSAQSELEEIKVYIQTWINKVAEPAILLKKQNKSAELSQLYNHDLGKQNFDDLRNKFESLHTKEIQSTKEHMSDLANKNRLLTIGIYIMLLVVAVIGLSIVAFVSGSIVKTIRQVVRAITDIASAGGDIMTRIKVNSRDEIRDLGEATNELLTSLEAKNWIQAKVAEVATMSQGINDLTTLGESFLAKVAPMINATYGVFYIRKETGTQQRLVNIASYAGLDEQESAGKAAFVMGEGLVGQSALENRIFLLNGLQDHPAMITAGIGQIQPQSILIVPIEYENKVEAVVEFASLESFTSQHLKLLEEIEVDFGIAVNNVAGRMEVERLLSESQVLTEELQSQTEELQAQSEQLQMQQEEMWMTTKHLEEQNSIAVQKTKELEKAKEELEAYSAKLKQSSQYKTNFLANMSHELRTPLNSILILSQMLADNENRTLNEDETGYAKVIHSSGNDLLKLINDILDLSKIEAGKIILTIDEVNLTELPAFFQHTFEPIAESKGIQFRIETSPQLPLIWRTDGQRLQQIIKNLLSNAFKFIKEGSVVLSLEPADQSIVQQLLPMYPNEQMMAISVRDTGIGIPPDKQQLVFEAFQQADGETNREYGGTGLGLSICNEFAKLLGGKIMLDSTPGAGSTFTLYLPNLTESRVELITKGMEEAAAAADSQVVIIANHEEENEADGSQQSDNEDALFIGKRVLIVEDDARNVFALVKALERKGVQAAVAGNGWQCMEVLQKEDGFDLILMDIMMPLMDGFEAIRAIRKTPALKNIPIIALTAKAMKSDRDRCLEAGASDYISKPINMEQLFSLMRVWLTKQVK